MWPLLRRGPVAGDSGPSLSSRSHTAFPYARRRRAMGAVYHIRADSPMSYRRSESAKIARDAQRARHSTSRKCDRPQVLPMRAALLTARRAGNRKRLLTRRPALPAARRLRPCCRSIRGPGQGPQAASASNRSSALGLRTMSRKSSAPIKTALGLPWIVSTNRAPGFSSVSSTLGRSR